MERKGNYLLRAHGNNALRNRSCKRVLLVHLLLHLLLLLFLWMMLSRRVLLLGRWGRRLVRLCGALHAKRSSWRRRGRWRRRPRQNMPLGGGRSNGMLKASGSYLRSRCGRTWRTDRSIDVRWRVPRHHRRNRGRRGPGQRGRVWWWRRWGRQCRAANEARSWGRAWRSRMLLTLLWPWLHHLLRG